MASTSFIPNLSLYRTLRPSRRLACSFAARPARPLCSATLQTPTPRPPKAPHEPVLVEEIVSHFAGRRLETFVDGTLGAGGHAQALLSSCEIGRYIGIDKDGTALSTSASRLSAHKNVTLLQGDFRNMESLLQSVGVREGEVDGILLDVGVSSMQLDEARRGFSFSRDGPLDMRMCGGASGGASARDLVNGASAERLEAMFREYGEERQAGAIARAMVAARERRAIETTGELAEVVCTVKGWRKKGVHPATLCFQAIRIAVNGELDALGKGLPGGVRMLRGGGRMAVVSFHSLEDRIAKRWFREMAGWESGGVGIVNKKPVVAGVEEARRNVRSRSAKLRVVQKLETGEGRWGRKVNKYARESRG